MGELSERDLILLGRVLPSNTSATNFTDFRCSVDDLAALLDAARKEGANAAFDAVARRRAAEEQRIRESMGDFDPPGVRF